MNNDFVCQNKKADKVGKIILYHGTPDKMVVPAYSVGNGRHDYGRGFYLTENIELAKEWAVCKPNGEDGWVHKYELDCVGLKILDFQEKKILSWLACGCFSFLHCKRVCAG